MIKWTSITKRVNDNGSHGFLPLLIEIYHVNLQQIEIYHVNLQQTWILKHFFIKMLDLINKIKFQNKRISLLN